MGSPFAAGLTAIVCLVAACGSRTEYRGPEAPASGGTTEQAATPSELVSRLCVSAAHKLRAGDGAGCLADLAAAARIDRARAEECARLGAECEMRAGRCAEGREQLRHVLARDKSLDEDRPMLEHFVATAAARSCPAAQLTADEKLVAAQLRIQEAFEGGDGATCLELATFLMEELPKSSPSGAKEKVEHDDGSPLSPRSLAIAAVRQAGICVGKAGRCDEARRLMRWYKHETFGRLNAQFGAVAMPADELEDLTEAELTQAAPECL